MTASTLPAAPVEVQGVTRNRYIMSTIQVAHIKSAMESRFGALVDVCDVPEAEQADCLLTRSLAAFLIAELAKVDDARAASCVVDGFMDNGIDAIYYDRTEHVCYLVQSKWIKSGNGSISTGTILKLTTGIQDLLEVKREAFGPKMQAKWADVKDIVADSLARFVVVIAYTGKQALSPSAEAPLKKRLIEWNDDGPLVSERLLGLKDLHRIIEQKALGDAINLTILMHEFGLLSEPYKAYYGQVNIADIVTWRKYGDYVYRKNLRSFKGSTEVNDAIVATINQRPENFWYFNNGVTVLCGKINKQPLGGSSHASGVFECIDASVVNGAQTVGSIISAHEAGGTLPGEARVLMRLISLEGCPPDFASELTAAANTQNRIEKRDFAALDPEQSRLRSDLQLSFGKEYVYRTGDKAPLPDKGCTLDEVTVALACAYPDLALCMLAKREVSKLYENIEQPPYTLIFNSSVAALRVWRAVEVLRAVDVALKTAQADTEGKERLVAIHGNRFILHLVFKAAPSELLGNTKTKLDTFLASVPDVTDRIRKKVLDATMALYPTAYPSNLFKNVTKCRELAKAIDKQKAVLKPLNDPAYS